MKSYQNLYRGVFLANFKERMIPSGLSVNEYVNKFQDTLKECIKVCQLLKSGADIENPTVQSILKSDNISSISLMFYSDFAFYRLSENYLISMSNTIIATCSTIASLSALSFKDASNLESISNATSDAINLYISLTPISISQTEELLKFRIFEIEKDLSVYLDLESEKKKIEKKEKELEDIKFKSHVCYLCNERPAISALLPCGHTFLCLECLEEAIKTRNIWKCFVCGKKLDSVIRIKPPH